MDPISGPVAEISLFLMDAVCSLVVEKVCLMDSTHILCCH